MQLDEGCSHACRERTRGRDVVLRALRSHLGTSAPASPNAPRLIARSIHDHIRRIAIAVLPKMPESTHPQSWSNGVGLSSLRQLRTCVQARTCDHVVAACGRVHEMRELRYASHRADGRTATPARAMSRVWAYFVTRCDACTSCLEPCLWQSKPMNSLCG